MINYIKANSSFIISMEYKNDNLIVEMKGGTYKYKKVPVEIWKAILTNDSLGKAYNLFIKNKFEVEKLEKNYLFKNETINNIEKLEKRIKDINKNMNSNEDVLKLIWLQSTLQSSKNIIKNWSRHNL